MNKVKFRAKPTFSYLVLGTVDQSTIYMYKQIDRFDHSNALPNMLKSFQEKNRKFNKYLRRLAIFKRCTT